MYFKRKELCNKKTDTLKSILINKGDDMSLYTVKLINDLEQKLTLQGFVSSFLDKEAKNLGVNRNYLYLHMVDDKLYLEEQNDDDYHFGLRNVREVE